jgi:hypothetical protein
MAIGGIGVTRHVDAEFEVPPLFAVADRRMAGRAVDCWRACGGGPVDGFAANSLTIVDPAGIAWISCVGDAVSRSFGLAAGMRLDGRAGLASELRAACGLIAIDPQPVPFETSLPAPAGGVLLVRGVALPVDARAGVLPDRVQIIVNWREVLNRAATTRLRHELRVEMRLISQDSRRFDPFLRDSDN